jgi:preprotein translocase subunit SecG
VPVLFNFLLILLIIDGLILTAVILMQSGTGGGLASMGGGAGTDSNLIGGRQAVTLLTKTSWVTGGVFLGLALLLSIISSRNNAGGSVLKGTFTAPPAATQPTTPGTTPGTAPAPLPGTQTTPAPATSTTGQ